MAARSENLRFASHGNKSVGIGFFLMFLPVIAAIFLLAYNSDIHESFPYLFLLPWILALLVVLLTPAAILWFRGKLEFENPIILASFTYFIPAFVIGGITLSVGLSQPYYLTFIQDSKTDLPYTVFLIMLGYAGMAAGFYLPVGRRIGSTLSNYLPRSEPEADRFVLPGFLLLFLGVFNLVIAAVGGIIGFRRVEEIGTFDGILLLSTYFWLQGSFILWYAVFRQPTFSVKSYAIMAALLTVSVGKALFTGNRGSFLSLCIMIGLAFLLSGRKLNFRRGVLAGFVALFAIVGGMIYGTTFRNTSGLHTNVGLEQYTENIFTTFEQIGSGESWAVTELSLMALAERIDIVSSVAVVVSNYEKLAPYEESYGLDDNIWKDTTSFFVPRIVWNDKPVASDPTSYSDLYFNYPENTFAITPIGDLVRNYGAPGVLIGMALLGLLMRIIYRTLVEDQPRMLWRASIYFMLITAISFEGFYGSILPFVIKVGISSSLGIMLVLFLSKRIQPSKSLL